MEQYDVRWFAPGSKRYGPEVEGERPWVVLSDQRTHDCSLGIVVPFREFKYGGGLEARTVPPSDKDNKIDLQQLWTFPSDRDITVRKNEPVRKLVEESVVDVLGKLGRRLTPVQSAVHTKELWSLGRVVFVRLALPTPEILVDGDYLAVRRAIAKRTASPWREASPELLATVIVANRRSRENGSGLSLVTVVPIVDVPEFQKRFPQNPTVALPNASGCLSAMTQCVLTVSCSDADERIVASNGQQESWMIQSEEFYKIVQDVAQWLGLKITCPTINLS